MKRVNGWAYPDADDFMSHEMKADGTYQIGHLKIALGFVTDRRCAVDGGAHVGTWSKVMAGLFDRVLAFEPSPDTAEALRANMDAFGCRNVQVIEAAVGDLVSQVSMAPLDPRAADMKNTGARYIDTSGGRIPMMTIDALELDALGFLKLDIEGAEPLALQGASDTLRRCRPIVLFENKGFCRRFGFKKTGPADVLTLLGYRQLATAGCDLIWGPR